MEGTDYSVVTEIVSLLQVLNMISFHLKKNSSYWLILLFSMVGFILAMINYQPKALYTNTIVSYNSKVY